MLTIDCPECGGVKNPTQAYPLCDTCHGEGTIAVPDDWDREDGDEGAGDRCHCGEYLDDDGRCPVCDL